MSFKFESIELNQAFGRYRNNVHSSHILLWTKDSSKSPEVVYGLMQMRSDGRFGFPGGRSEEQTVDENEIVRALYRELEEEINFTPVEGQITLEDRVFTHRNIMSGKILHFFVKEISLTSFKNIEATHMNAIHFPKESIGVNRILLKASGRSTYAPVRTFFRYFGRHSFAGNARNQLIESVLKLHLIGEDDRHSFINYMNI